MDKLDIIFEDDDILVINKPSGVVVNNSITSPENTIQNLITPNKTDTDSTDEENVSEFEQRSGIVHRIDKDTSGVLLIAKNNRSFVNLQKQFKRRTVKKEYMALVNGKMPDEIIEINAPIARHPAIRTKFAVVKDGKEAQTRVEKIKEIQFENEVLTLVRVFPKTGRTHQIRVHLTSMGNPVVGDIVYGTTKQLSKLEGTFNRLMLHAHKLEISHPIEGSIYKFEAPLPEQFIAVMK